MAKTVIVGVSSSVACFKAVQLVSDLVKMKYDVEVIMTKNACEFVTPLSFSSLTKHNVSVDTFDHNIRYEIGHISLAKKADAFIICPATANVIAKVVHGIADDMLTTTFLACDCPKIICPAMNTGMYLNPITQDNLALAKKYGYHIVEPIVGHLACGDNGLGKLADLETIEESIAMAVNEKPLKGKKVLISAGPTVEAIDPVRFISNHSSGKMGYALARSARNLGAEVHLVSGPTNLAKPYAVNVYDVQSADEMYNQIMKLYPNMDYAIMAAAVADYRPQNIASQKIKKNNQQLTLELTKNIDILKELGEKKTHQKLCGFAMETENALVNGRQKFKNKNCDLLVLNDLFEEGAGFKVDTNVVTLISKDAENKLDKMSKNDLADVILHRLIEL